MAALALGVPLVTTDGRLSEPFWRESGAVRLANVGDADAMASQVANLLQHPDVRRELGAAGRALYARLFDLSRTIGALRRADAERAA
jgi:glycosyltransferase involved in cell wall biosynthesis